MKKVFAILAIAGFMVACNNGSENQTENKDTSKTAPVDTTKMAPVDTTTKTDTTKM